MVPKDWKTPEEWADVLDEAIRDGALEDQPEGARHITLSDTLAKQMARDLREAHDWYADLYDNWEEY